MSEKSTMMSRREVEVLRLLSRGWSPAEVGRQLRISKRTVDFHLTNIYAKLGVNRRIHAIQRAIDIGLIQ